MSMPGTNLCAPEMASGVTYILNDASGNALLVTAATGDIPSAKAGYAVGCLLINTTSGVLYYNNSVTSCTFATV